jgi:hypothetical protein
MARTRQAPRKPVDKPVENRDKEQKIDETIDLKNIKLALVEVIEKHENDLVELLETQKKSSNIIERIEYRLRELEQLVAQIDS